MMRTLGALAGTVLVLAATACGTSEPSQAEEEQADAAQAEAAGGPITLTDDAGRTVELPAPAQDVVVLEWQQVENVLALGVEPVGVADVEGYNTWDSAEPLDPEVADVGLRGEPNMQAIFEQDPDLIIAEVVGPSDAVIKRFEKYDVPVLATIGADAEDPIAKMESTFRLIAQALGKEAEADEVMADFEETLAEAEQEISDAQLESTKFAYMDAYVQGSTLSVRPFGQGSLVGELGEAIGLTNVWDGKVDELYGLGQTDLEGITSIDDEAWLFYTGTERDTWYDAVEGNPLWENAAFVQEDRVAAFPDGIWTFGGPRSSEQVVEAFVDSLT
ncbi:ABC transporter substrate-binding protein [Nocardioides sp. GXQ0305]|uniref:ABC transporter substrate-binding protein n=1 Tax=Nocardioides sp. GXQ0305 TaxID=3423912 RepID=UPI003D7E546C